jgi:hypothetical protein
MFVSPKVGSWPGDVCTAEFSARFHPRGKDWGMPLTKLRSLCDLCLQLCLQLSRVNQESHEKSKVRIADVKPRFEPIPSKTSLQRYHYTNLLSPTYYCSIFCVPTVSTACLVWYWSRWLSLEKRKEYAITCRSRKPRLRNRGSAALAMRHSSIRKSWH